MKPLRQQIFISVLCLLSLLIGCAPDNQSTLPPSSPDATSSRAATQTNLDIPTDTITAIVTLPPDKAYAQLFQYLTNTPPCQLPCWLGITPGKSILEDFYDFLSQFGSIATDVDAGHVFEDMIIGRSSFTFSGDTLVIELNTNYITMTGEEIISALGFSHRAYRIENGEYAEDVYGTQEYYDLLQPYTLTGILANYGVPNNVLIESYLRGDTTITPGFGDLFIIHLWYPESGIFIQYRMQVQGILNKYSFCPSDAFIYGAIIPQGLGSSYKDMLLKIGGKYEGFFPPDNRYIKTPEEAFGMSTDEFYQRFKSPTELCLETPKEVWWPEGRLPGTPAP